MYICDLINQIKKIMKRITGKVLIVLFILTNVVIGQAQENDSRILMTVGDEKVTVGEFLHVYNTLICI